MGVLSNPKFAYFVRNAQFLLSIGFLFLIFYAGTHQGRWKAINGTLAIGAITSILTFAVTIFNHYRGNPFAGKGRVFTFVRLGVEVLTILLWIASATLMLQHNNGYNDTSGSFDWTDEPRIPWDIAIAFSFIEIVSFIFSAVVVFVDNKSVGVYAHFSLPLGVPSAQPEAQGYRTAERSVAELAAEPSVAELSAERSVVELSAAEPSVVELSTAEPWGAPKALGHEMV